MSQGIWASGNSDSKRMAEAASRITGKPAVCFGTLGPGLANMMPAIQCCKVENSPVIFLGGQRARVAPARPACRKGQSLRIAHARFHFFASSLMTSAPAGGAKRNCAGSMAGLRSKEVKRSFVV